jgi:hypothetical protein
MVCVWVLAALCAANTHNLDQACNFQMDTQMVLLLLA